MKLKKQEHAKASDSVRKEMEPHELDPDAMIQTFNLKKYYQITEGIVVKALDGVSLTVKRGDFISVMGPSGSGKTTLLNMIGALDNPTSGEVYIDGVNIAHMDDEERTYMRLNKIGFIFQFYNLVPVLTAFENVELPLVFAEKPKEEREEKAHRFLDLVGLGDRKDFLPSELSGGEQQRVAVARALVNEPAILVADEPTGELDTVTGMQIVRLIQELNENLKQTTIMVTHDPDVGALAKRTLRMLDGRIFDSMLN
ncbi:MAG: ABC transporter ATP-binding protein [Promethearchaeota archaeon]